MSYVLNPFTGNLTITDSNQASKTITHERTSAGNLINIFDTTLSVYLNASPVTVISNDGSIVRMI